MSYAQQSDIEDTFGPSNVAAWSLFEPGVPDSPANQNRVVTALAYADAEVNAFFADGPYAIPLSCSVTQSTVTYWAAIIAGVWLYGSRASVSYVDYSGNRYLALKAAVYADMYLYRAGVKRLDATLRWPHATSPTAI